jgi:hypothetical protein
MEGRCTICREKIETVYSILNYKHICATCMRALSYAVWNCASELKRGTYPQSAFFAIRRGHVDFNSIKTNLQKRIKNLQHNEGPHAIGFSRACQMVCNLTTIDSAKIAISECIAIKETELEAIKVEYFRNMNYGYIRGLYMISDLLQGNK